METIKEALTFDDVLLLPQYSSIIPAKTNINVNLSDTLCGTKVFKKESLYSLKKWQESMSIADPFCDFDLIFSNAISGVKISEYPVHYRNRKYGKTNISRFRDGWKLIIYLFNSLLLFKSSYYRSLYKND